MQFSYLLLFKKLFLDYSVSKHFAAKGSSSKKFLGDYLINVADCLFAYK